MEPRDRQAARILLVDGQDRVLLFRGGDPAEPGSPYWFTPGGGLDPGESPAEGAIRELYEETGLRVSAESLGEPVHEDVTLFSFDGVSYRQAQHFFLVRVHRWEVDTVGFEGYEAATIDAHRWWSVPELRATPETFYPQDLVQVLTRLGIPTC